MVASLIRAVDASIPPPSASDLPAGTEAIFGYLGGNTPHAWTVDEWSRFDHLLQMGIWVADVTGDPIAQARRATDAARGLGWEGHDLRGVLIDDEDHDDPDFVGEMGLKLYEYGYVPLGYESTGVLNANPRLNGIILAQPDDPPVVPPGQLIIGRQYKWNVPCAGTLIDLSVLDSSARHLFGHGPRK